MDIVFMGTPEFAVPSLTALHRAGHRLLAVYTQPDKPAGRGRNLAPPPVKEGACCLGLPVRQPVSFRSDAVVEELHALRPDLVALVAYGKILPQRVLDIPRLGALNAHASLLPLYRGAAPIQWSVVSGERETGISIMRVERELDAGDVMLQEREPIRPDDTSGTLHDRLKELGAACLVRAVQLVQDGTARFTPQDHSKATWAPSLTRSSGRVDWSNPAAACFDFVRGMNPWPAAWSLFRGEPLKILHAKPVRADATPVAAKPGAVDVSGRFPLVACGDGLSVEIAVVQAPGRSPVSGRDWVNGARPREGERFE